MKISVIIPTLNASHYLPRLLGRLSRQTVKPLEIIVIDSASTDDTPRVAQDAGVSFLSIPRSEFNHGGTRNRAASSAQGEYLVFLTQDALPMNDHLLQNLVEPLADDSLTAISYGRQVAYEGAREIEKFVRAFNYPDKSLRKGRDDIERLGIKTFFCSNACAAYNAEVFRSLGGFRADTIMNEDMEYVFRAVQRGYFSYYAAGASVWHSHDYSISQQFRRYIDIGVFFSCNQDIMRCARNEGEGVKYLTAALGVLLGKRCYRDVFHLVVDSMARFAGYRIGLSQGSVPASLMRRISMNTGYWDTAGAGGKT